LKRRHPDATALAGRVGSMNVKRGIYVAPFDELVEPGLLAELAQLAETHGWDGFFVGDRMRDREAADRPDGDALVETQGA